MQKSLYSFLIAAALASPATAQHLKVKSHTIDVGQVVYRQPVTAQFELSNADSRTVSIEGVETSCGCTVTDMQRQTVPANSRVMLNATFDAKQMGHFEKYVYVRMKGRKQPLTLTLKGIVVSEVSEYQGQYDYQLGTLMTDRKDIDFGDVVKGDNPFVDIHVKNTTDRPLSPVIMHQPSYLQSEASPTTIPPGKTGVVRLILASQSIKDYGQVHTKVYLGDRPGDKTSNDKAMEVEALVLPNIQMSENNMSQKMPRLQLSANNIDFGNFDGKAKKTVTLTLENAGDDVLDIYSMMMFTEGVKVSLPKWKLKKGEHTRMKITGERRQLLQMKTEPYILIITNDPQNTKVTLNIKANNE